MTFIHYRSQGIFIKKESRAEADQLFTIYTKDFGKLKVLGKGIRKTSSKLRAGADIFYLSEIEFIQGKTYKTLTDAILIDKFKNLRKSLKRLSVAYKISETLDELISAPEPDEKIWLLLIEVFQKLNDVRLQNAELVYYYFFWNLVSTLGYQPELYRCSLCQKKLKMGKLYFSKKEGGIICQSCTKKIHSTFEIKPEIVKILRIILERNGQLLFRLKMEKDYLKGLNEISQSYLSFVKEKSGILNM